MGIEWKQNVYASVPTDLGLNGLQWSTDPPAGWLKSSTLGIHEETLQTLLAFHLSEVSEEPIQLIGYAGDYWGGADIIGLDDLGRIHLFELKRRRVSEEAARQLSYYLLGHVFKPPQEFINDRWKRMGEWELQIKRLAVSIAGALSGHRTNNVGYAFVREQLSTVTMSKYEWTKLGYDGKNPLLLAALIEKSKERLDQVPTKEVLLDTAAIWRSRLWAKGKLVESLFMCERPVVIWLVGVSFAPEVETEIQKWRAAGVDARCIQTEVRFSSNRDGLMLRIAREVAPTRIELVKLLQQWGKSHKIPDVRAKLKLNLYTEARPSDKMEWRETCGHPLESPNASIELPNGEFVDLSVPED